MNNGAWVEIVPEKGNGFVVIKVCTDNSVRCWFIWLVQKLRSYFHNTGFAYQGNYNFQKWFLLYCILEWTNAKKWTVVRNWAPQKFLK